MDQANPNYDHRLASKGRELHARLLNEAHVHSFYIDGSLFGAATPEPRASICVPAGAWTRLDDDERASLKHYAASLVAPMMGEPLRFAQIPDHAPAAEALRRNAASMTPDSWVIFEGRLKEVEGDEGNFDILTDKPVASGSDGPLRD